jgi:hypothetical protein
MGSRPPSQNHSRPSSAQMPHGTSLVITNTNDDNLFEEDFAEDAQMNHLFDEELLDGTIIGETQQSFTPSFDSVAPDLE